MAARVGIAGDRYRCLQRDIQLLALYKLSASTLAYPGLHWKTGAARLKGPVMQPVHLPQGWGNHNS